MDNVDPNSTFKKTVVDISKLLEDEKNDKFEARLNNVMKTK